ncbi:ParB N-terminal domain-containing protein [Promicromonospora soli]
MAADLVLDRAVDSITVGARHRRDLGDLDGLAASIDRLGLLQPVTITPDGLLICGLRRLEAVKRLGWDRITVCVRSGISTALAALLAERDENGQRKDLDPVEASELYDEILEIERTEAARRQAASRFGAASDSAGDRRTQDADGNNSETVGAGPWPQREESGRADRRAAALVTGKDSHRRLQRVSALRSIADDERASSDVRKLAADAIQELRAGAPVFPTYSRVMQQVAALDPTRQTAEPVAADEIAEAAAEALARVSTRKGDKPTTEPKANAKTLRSWAFMWRTLDGWDDSYDPAIVAPAVSEKEWATFEHVVDSVIAFRDAGRAARESAAEPPSDEATTDARPKLRVVAS